MIGPELNKLINDSVMKVIKKEIKKIELEGQYWIVKVYEVGPIVRVDIKHSGHKT